MVSIVASEQKVPGSIPGSLCVELVCSPLVFVFRFPPAVQKNDPPGQMEMLNCLIDAPFPTLLWVRERPADLLRIMLLRNI